MPDSTDSQRHLTTIDGATAWADEWKAVNIGSTKYRYCGVHTTRDGFHLFTQVQIDTRGRIEDGQAYGCVATRTVLDLLLEEARARINSDPTNKEA